jgi:hypothetical protein
MPEPVNIENRGTENDHPVFWPCRLGSRARSSIGFHQNNLNREILIGRV